jgi:phosphomevalonate kinase
MGACGVRYVGCSKPPHLYLVGGALVLSYHVVGVRLSLSRAAPHSRGPLAACIAVVKKLN